MTTTTDHHDPTRTIVPAGAYDDLLARVLPQARDHRLWEPADGPMPALFVSHGAPFTLDDGPWLDDLFGWAQSLPKPRGIIVVSAHWEDAPATITGARAGTPLHYDFDGFHPRYKTLPYATPDASELSRRLAAALGSRTPVVELAGRGLDHGAFVPLMAMYPAADVGVVQLSMPSVEPGDLFRLGRRLRSLRDEGYLVVGSGFMTHSFAAIRRPELAGHISAFDEWAADALGRVDVDALTDYRAKGPGVEVAHPTADHYVPLLLTVGASSDSTGVTTTIERMVMGNSIRSVQMS